MAQSAVFPKETKNLLCIQHDTNAKYFYIRAGYCGLQDFLPARKLKIRNISTEIYICKDVI